MKKELKHFEEMPLENLANIRGGASTTILNGDTSPNLTYPNGDNIDWTVYGNGTSKSDGMGGGTCSISIDPNLSISA